MELISRVKQKIRGLCAVRPDRRCRTTGRGLRAEGDSSRESMMPRRATLRRRTSFAWGIAPERLEPRRLLAAITVNTGSVVRAVNDDVLGINLAWWDSTLNTA